MGEAERVDLNAKAMDLDPAKLAEAADFIGYLKAKQQRELDEESRVWLGAVEPIEPYDDDRAWMDADLSNLAAWEPFDWGPDGPPKGQPVTWDEARGAFVIEATADAR